MYYLYDRNIVLPRTIVIPDYCVQSFGCNWINKDLNFSDEKEKESKKNILLLPFYISVFLI